MWGLEDVPATVPEFNRVAWMKYANSLKAKAVPGNWAFRRLEELTGNDGDYINGQDDGEWIEPKGI